MRGLTSQGGVKLLKAFITGIAGFAGSHLTELILGKEGVEVSGIIQPGLSIENIAHLQDRLNLVPGDLCDGQFVERVFDRIRPDLVFHLAAQAAIPASLSSPSETLLNNIVSQVCVLEAARKLVHRPRILIIGSGDEYGMVGPDELPVRECNPFRPTSPYSVSKITQDMLGLQYYISHQIPVVRVRPFNHIGPRQGLGFVTSSFAKQVAAAELGLTPPVVRVGNLEAKRDFTDVRDVVRAYWLALEKGAIGEVYNIGSGRSRRIREVLDILVSQSRVPIKVEIDPERLRPSDTHEVVCDASRFREATGWEPMISFEQSLFELLEYWRTKLSRAA